MSSFNKVYMIATLVAAMTSVQAIHAQQLIAHREGGNEQHHQANEHRDGPSEQHHQANEHQGDRNHERNWNENHRNGAYDNRGYNNRGPVVVPIPVNNSTEGVILNDSQQTPAVQVNVSPTSDDNEPDNNQYND